MASICFAAKNVFSAFSLPDDLREKIETELIRDNLVIARLAIRNNNLEIFNKKTIYPMNERMRHFVWEFAVSRQKHSVVEILVKNGIKYDGSKNIEIYENAIKSNNFKLFKLVQENCTAPKKQGMLFSELAAEIGNIEILRRILKIYNMTITDFHLLRAAGNGRLKLIKWILLTYPRFQNDDIGVFIILTEAAYNGKLNIVQYFYDNKYFNIVNYYASQQPHIQEWLYNQQRCERHLEKQL